MSHAFLGITVGQRSLRAALIAEDGTALCQVKVRHRALSQLPTELEQLLGTAREAVSDAAVWPSLRAVSVGLEKNHRCAFPEEALTALLPDHVALLFTPALSATLLGSIPTTPGLLLSLGAELRLAVIDATRTYREFRLNEGGGRWWLAELERLSRHSPRLAQQLGKLPADPEQRLRHLPRLLELGDYPAPDPVLKPRLDRLGEMVSDSCWGLSTRLPGLSRLAISGYLHPGPMSDRVVRRLKNTAPYLKVRPQGMPAEAGAALLGLAYHKENQEREHLGRELLSPRPRAKGWAPHQDLLRRLSKLRKPFAEFVR